MEQEKPIKFILNEVDKKNLNVCMELIITKIEEKQFEKIIYLQNKTIWEAQHKSK